MAMYIDNLSLYRSLEHLIDTIILGIETEFEVNNIG
jgi:hypothetical protein